VLNYEIILPICLQDSFNSLPSWRNDNYLLDYVSTLEEKINFQIQEYFSKFEKKKEFIEKLTLKIGIQPLEFDVVQFNTVSYLINQDDFIFILFITLDNYPNECPIIQLQSVQYLDKKSNSIIRCKLKSIKYDMDTPTDDKVHHSKRVKFN
jgi:hypothetical protein